MLVGYKLGISCLHRKGSRGHEQGEAVVPSNYAGCVNLFGGSGKKGGKGKESIERTVVEQGGEG